MVDVAVCMAFTSLRQALQQGPVTSTPGDRVVFGPKGKERERRIPDRRGGVDGGFVPNVDGRRPLNASGAAGD
jgi:hypothetical protein